jgi:hypothetical protein
MQKSTRRDFLYTAGLTAGSLVAFLSTLSMRANKLSDKLTVACIGVGSQGLRVLIDLLRMPEVQIVAVCDVNRQTSDYLDWGPNELLSKVRLLLQDPNWGSTLTGPTAGRDIAQSITNAFYAKEAGKPTCNGCSSYEDFRGHCQLNG